MLIQVDEAALRNLIEASVLKAVEVTLKKAQEPEYVTTAQAAKLLCLSPRTLINWRQQRRIPYHKIGGRVVFRVDELREFLERRKVRAREDPDTRHLQTYVDRGK